MVYPGLDPLSPQINKMILEKSNPDRNAGTAATEYLLVSHSLIRINTKPSMEQFNKTGDERKQGLLWGGYSVQAPVERRHWTTHLLTRKKRDDIFEESCEKKAHYRGELGATAAPVTILGSVQRSRPQLKIRWSSTNRERVATGRALPPTAKAENIKRRTVLEAPVEKNQLWRA